MNVTESTSDLFPDIATCISFIGIFLAVAFRLLSGKFLVPSRIVVLPNQRGVLVQADRVIRIAEPGSCWVRPNQRVVLCDIRIRSLNMVGVEVFSSDSGIVRLSISGEFKIANPIVYYTVSTQANDALYVQVRKSILVVAKQMTSANIVAVPEVVARRLHDAAAPEAAKLGLQITDLQVWEASSLGWLRSVQSDQPDPDQSPTDLVH